MSAYDLARPEVRDLVPYDSAPVRSDFTRLNANEATVSPYPAPVAAANNRYPEIRSHSLRTALAVLFEVHESKLCVTRGSSEAIDLLVRTFCRAYRDNVVVLPPTFEMYAAYANMQAAEVRYAPLRSEKDFCVDWDAVAAQCDDHTRIVFLCSPNNPTGALIPSDEILQFAQEMSGKSIVVVDEAYVEYSEQPSLVKDVDRFDNLVVLRTLSKAYALAGARCGALISCAEIVRLTSALISPYAFSGPATSLVLDALQPGNIVAVRDQIKRISAERERLQSCLQKSAAIERVWPSAANFVLVRLRNPNDARRALAKHHVLIREFADESPLLNCARITVGTPAESEQLLLALNASAEGF